jgi:hypothetical protein
MYDRLSASGAQSSAQDAARTAGWTAEDCAHGWARAKASSEAVRTGWALSSSYDSGIGQGFRDLRTTIKGGERGSRSERVSIGATPSAGCHEIWWQPLLAIGVVDLWDSRRAPLPPKRPAGYRDTSPSVGRRVGLVVSWWQYVHPLLCTAGRPLFSPGAVGAAAVVSGPDGRPAEDESKETDEQTRLNGASRICESPAPHMSAL